MEKRKFIIKNDSVSLRLVHKICAIYNTPSDVFFFCITSQFF
jgi:hypothetical protein